MTEELVVPAPVLEQPYFSVVMPAYNCAHLIKRPLLSLEAQIFRDFELIIVDDCSTESFRPVLSIYEPTPFGGVTVLQTPANGGPGVARQVGLEAARGKYVVFIDADDYLISPVTLLNLYDVLQEHGEPDILSTNFLEIREDNSRVSHDAGNLAWVHGKAYRLEFLRVYGFQFPPFYCTEDGSFNMVVFPIAAKVVYNSNVESYLWTKNPTSIVNSQDYILKMMLGDYPRSFVFAYNEIHKNGLRLIEEGRSPNEKAHGERVMAGLRLFPVSSAIYIYLYYKALESRKVDPEALKKVADNCRDVLMAMNVVDSLNTITSRDEWIQNINWRIADELRTISRQQPDIVLNETFPDWLARILGEGERIRREWNE